MEIFLWLLLGGTAFVLVWINLTRAVVKKHQKWQVLLFASLSCGGLAMLCALQAVDYWVKREDWSGIMDVVPALIAVCTWALCIGIVLNLLALWVHMRAEKIEEKTDGKN